MGRALTVLHVLPQDSWRGAQVYAGALRDALVDDPAQRHLAVALFDGPVAGLRPDVVLTGRPTVRRRMGIDPIAAIRLRRLIRQRKVDVVVAHGGEPLKYAVASSGSVPVAYYKIGLASAELGRPARLSLYRFLSRHTVAGVAVSSQIGDQLRNTLQMPPGRIRIIPNARDPKVYFPAPMSPQVPPGLLWIGQFEEGKRPEMFMEVVEILRRRGHDVPAAMVGDGPLRERIEPRARSAGVTLLGRRADVPRLLREHTVAVMTSDANTEGMPGVLIEAGLSGLPVVSTDAAGVVDIVRDGASGYIVGSADAAATRLEELLADRRLCLEMGEAARQRCTTEFTFEAVAAHWAELADFIGSTRA